MKARLVFLVCTTLAASCVRQPPSDASGGGDPRGHVWVPEREPRYVVTDFDGNTSIVDLPEPGVLSPDGTRLASVRTTSWSVCAAACPADLELVVQEMSHAEPKKVASAFRLDFDRNPQRVDPYADEVVWSPTSAFVAAAVRDTVHGDQYLRGMIDREGNVRSSEIVGRVISQARWSPDGHWFALCDGSKAIVLLDPATLKRRTLMAATANEWIAHPTWSPDGKMVAVIRFGPHTTGEPVDARLEAIRVDGHG